MSVFNLSFLLAIDSFTAAAAIRLATSDRRIAGPLPCLFALCDALAILTGTGARNSLSSSGALAYGAAYVLVAAGLSWCISKAVDAQKKSSLALAMPIFLGFDNFVAARAMPVMNPFILAVLCAMMSGVLAYAGVWLGDLGSRYIVARSKRLITALGLLLIVLITR